MRYSARATKPEPHPRATSELRAQAALYSLGLLEADVAREFQGHLSHCAVCRNEVRGCEEVGGNLALGVEQEPPPHLRDKVLAAVRDTSPGISILRAADRGWTATPFRGVEVKPLYEDPVTRLVTQLVRLGPGAYYPSHRHTAPEQCYVIEGDVRIGNDVFGKGDFSLAVANSLHGGVSSRDGCLLMIVARPDNELFA